MSAEETHLLRWFRESHHLAKGAVAPHMAADAEWVDMPVQGVHTVELTQARMREIGFVIQDGQPPTREDPATLFWQQDKPESYKTKHGVWDPVGAQWKFCPSTEVVPVEQRIAPAGVGYGCTPDGAIVRDPCSFTAESYGEAYAGTALETGLPFIRQQIEALGAGAQVNAASGWGSMGGGRAFYTPHLRHVAIDSSVAEAPGKKYVYTFADAPVKPVDAHALWDATNTCWVFALDERGALLNEKSKFLSERAQDAGK